MPREGGTLAKDRHVRVLVTGATGYIGRPVVDALHAAGYAVVTAGRRPVDGADHLPCDLLDSPDLAALVRSARATHLMLLAWEAGHGAYWTHPDNPRWALTTAALVDAFCRAGGNGIAVAGSSAEYDWTRGWCREDDTPAVPATPYGQAKDAARRLCQTIARSAGVPLAWGRIFLSCGPGEDDRRLVPSVIDALRGRRAPFALDAEAQRDFLHVTDTAAALVRLLSAGADGVANVSSGLPVRVGDVVRGLARSIGADPAPLLALAARKDAEPRLLAGEPARLTALGWAPRVSLDEALALCAGARP